MSRKVDAGTRVFGAMALDKHLDDMLEEEAGVRRGDDPDAIHDMRVASRRLRAALDLFQDWLPAKRAGHWIGDVRQITKALGAARDLDVQLEVLRDFSQSHIENKSYSAGFRRLILRLSQKRGRTQEKVDQAMDTLDTGGMPVEFQEWLAETLKEKDQTYLYTAELYQRGYRAISIHLKAFLDYEPYIREPEAIKELHEMRIAAKKLRYTLEIFAPLYPGELKEPIQALRKVQDQLGDVHDCDVWTAFLPNFLDKERQRTQDFFGNQRGFGRIVPGVMCFLQDRQEARGRTYNEFVAFWDKSQEAGLWSQIPRTIQVPPARMEPVVASSGESGDDHEGSANR